MKRTGYREIVRFFDNECSEDENHFLTSVEEHHKIAREGDTIAIIPSFDTTTANAYADIVIPTGLDVMRNTIVANADAVIAIGGGAGTLSEMAMAWSLFRLIIAYDNVDGWSAELAGRRLDVRERYADSDDKIFAVSSVQECMAFLNEKINLYTRRHHGIKIR